MTFFVPILSEFSIKSLFDKNLKNISKYGILYKESNLIPYSSKRTSSCVVAFTYKE